MPEESPAGEVVAIQKSQKRAYKTAERGWRAAEWGKSIQRRPVDCDGGLQKKGRGETKGVQTLFRPGLFEAFCPAVAQSHNSCGDTLVDTRRRGLLKGNFFTPWHPLSTHIANTPHPPKPRCFLAVTLLSHPFPSSGHFPSPFLMVSFRRLRQWLQ